MHLGRKFLLLIPALIALGALVTAGTLLVTQRSSHTSRSAVLGKTITMGKADIGGPFTLVSTNGEVVDNESYRGKWLLIFFGYTFCPDVCPTSLNNVSIAIERLGSAASDIQPLFITVDPQRDTRDVLAAYLTSFDARITGLTGSQVEIDRVLKGFRVYVESQRSGDDDNYLVSHSAYVYLMDSRGVFVNVIQGTTSGEEMAVWLRKEMAQWKDKERRI